MDSGGDSKVFKISVANPFKGARCDASFFRLEAIGYIRSNRINIRILAIPAAFVSLKFIRNI
jgi:hypothetical protein